jgi:hypothetical protein
VILVVHEVIYNDTANHSILSEFQLRDFGVKIDSICHTNGGTQKMETQNVGNSLVVPLELAGCMIHFIHRLPTTEEINSLKQYFLTHGDTTWNPSNHFLIKLLTSFINRSLIMNKRTVLMLNLIILLILRLTYLNKTFLSFHTLIHLMHMIQMSKENMQI